MDRRGFLAGAGALGFAGAAQAGGGPVEMPLRMSHGLPWVAVRFEAHAPEPFLLSTGVGALTPSADLAARLQLPRQRPRDLDILSGRRLGVAHYARRVVVEEALLLHNRSYPALSDLRDPDFAGALGGVFSRVGAHYDFDRRKLTATSPGRLPAEGFVPTVTLGEPPVVREPAGSAMSSYVRAAPLRALREAAGAPALERRPIVTAELDGRRLRLLVDTGYAGGVLLFSGRGSEPAAGTALAYGVQMPSELKRASKLTLAGFAVERPVVEIVRTDRPVYRTGLAVDGAIGMEVLRRFQLITETPEHRVWLKAGAQFAEPFRYNRAGLALQQRDGRVRVAEVLPQGPAARAGLRGGDDLGLVSPRALEARFKGPAGRTIQLARHTAAGEERLSIRLEELV
jgi:hypothetical protein